MNNTTDPTQRFISSLIANGLRVFLTPAYYVMRSDMGVQHTAIAPLVVGTCLDGGLWTLVALRSEVDCKVTGLYAVLGLAGYIRNLVQARRRRRKRDWSVNSWSTGRSLLEPVLYIASLYLLRNSDSKRSVVRLVRMFAKADFVYYFGEPLVLVGAAIALWSIGSIFFFYPLLIAIALIFVRNDAQLYIYLRAHEVMDGRMLEQSIQAELEPPAPGTGSIPVAQIPTGFDEREAGQGVDRMWISIA